MSIIDKIKEKVKGKEVAKSNENEQQEVDLRPEAALLVQKGWKNLQLLIENEDGTSNTINLNASDMMGSQKVQYLKNDIIPNGLHEYLVDMTRIMATKKTIPIKGREEEIDKIWFHLTQKRRNNVFVVGGIDSGKTALAWEIARRIAICDCPSSLYQYRMIAVQPDNFLRILSRGVKATVMNAIKQFVAKNKVILYVDKASYMVSDNKLYDLLMYSVKSNYPIMFSTRYDEVDWFEGDYFIGKYENKVYLPDIETDDLYDIISERVRYLEWKNKVKISPFMTKFAIYTANLYNNAFYEEDVLYEPGRTLSILEKAVSDAKRKGMEELTKENIINTYDEYKKYYNSMSKEDIITTAYHEVGHYITLKKSGISSMMKTACVSIVPLQDFLGVNYFYMLLGKDVNINRHDLIERIATSLGGRSAEKLIIGNISTGAAADLVSANVAADNMILSYGLSKRKNPNRIYTHDDIALDLLTDEEKTAINKEITDIIAESEKLADKIITENKETMDLIVDRLLTEKILIGEELDEIISIADKKKAQAKKSQVRNNSRSKKNTSNSATTKTRTKKQSKTK